MGNVIISAIILSILGLSISKVISEKRKGIKCIGCPNSKSCSNTNGITLIK